MIIDKLLYKDHADVAYFYMAFGRVQSASKMVASLVSQLSKNNDTIPECIRTYYHTERNPRTPPLPKLHQALRELSETLHDVIIVIDAFEDHNMDSRDEFEQTLSVLRDLPWKLFLTCRKYDWPSPNLKEVSVEVTIAIEKGDIAQDIELLVSKGLESFLKAHEHIDLPLTLKSEIVSGVVHASPER
jgi:hypothetical protein